MTWKNDIDASRTWLERTDRVRGGLARRFHYEVFWKPGAAHGAYATHLCLLLAACLVGALFVSWLLQSLGWIPTVDGIPIASRFHEEPWLMVVLGLALVPPFEEAIFRLLPRVVSSYWWPLKRAHWPLGLSTALLFAFLHLPPTDLGDPYSHFLLGLALWFVQWKHGFFGGVILHASYNGILLLWAALLPGMG